MGLRTRKAEDFSAITKDAAIYGDYTVIIRGGSVVINNTWVHFKDISLNIKKYVDDYISSSPRLFNALNSVIYLLVCMTEGGSLELVPNISYLQTTSGDTKQFPDLSGKLPLLLVKLVQDGTNSLTGYNPITMDDIKVYDGYGNYTLMGALGDTGAKGDTGQIGIIGNVGITGQAGPTGYQGPTGLDGLPVKGIIGPKGPQGEAISWHTPQRTSLPIVDFIGTPTSGSAGLAVSYTDLSTGSPTSWYWDFGDGTTGSIQNPTHTYNSPGTYDVYLRVENEAGFGEELKHQYIVAS